MRLCTLLALTLCLVLSTESARDVLPEPVDTRPVVRVADSHDCEACVWGIRFAEDILADRDLVAIAASKVSEAICKEVPSDKQSNCMEYGEIIFSVVVGYLQATYHEAVPQLACSPLCSDTMLRGLFTPHRESKVNGAMECAFCEFAVSQFQDALEDDSERAAVMDKARAACKKLPETMQAACLQYVDEKGPIIIALIESAQPEKVCETLNACEGSARPELPAELVQVSTQLAALMVPSLRPVPTGPAVLRGPQECELCKVAVMEIHDKLEEPAFQQAVIAYAKRVCDRLGENMAKQCSQMVDQYAPLVFSMLEDELKPEEFCEMIHLCDPRRF